MFIRENNKKVVVIKLSHPMHFVYAVEKKLLLSYFIHLSSKLSMNYNLNINCDVDSKLMLKF